MKENMSRSNPNETLPHPCKIWLEWVGNKGLLRYFDKEKKENVEVELPFEFVLLDRLATIKGWNDNSESGIYSNEVRDTRSEPFVVKAFKLKEPIAQGFYMDIKDRVKAAGGRFTLNCYIAYPDEEKRVLCGSVQFHGAALSAFMEFENNKEVRPLLYKKGLRIADTKEGKKGSIKFQVPVFELVDIPERIDKEATEKDRELQAYLKSYFARTKVEQTEPAVEDTDGAPITDRTDREMDQSRPADEDEQPPF